MPAWELGRRAEWGDGPAASLLLTGGRSFAHRGPWPWLVPGGIKDSWAQLLMGRGRDIKQLVTGQRGEHMAHTGGCKGSGGAAQPGLCVVQSAAGAWGRVATEEMAL